MILKFIYFIYKKITIVENSISTFSLYGIDFISSKSEDIKLSESLLNKIISSSTRNFSISFKFVDVDALSII